MHHFSIEITKPIERAHLRLNFRYSSKIKRMESQKPIFEPILSCQQTLEKKTKSRFLAE